VVLNKGDSGDSENRWHKAAADASMMMMIVIADCLGGGDELVMPWHGSEWQ
jgi:hypothetical protein